MKINLTTATPGITYEVFTVHVAPGTIVDQEAPLLALEGGKEALVIKAPNALRVEKVLVAPGDKVTGGAALLEVTSFRGALVKEPAIKGTAQVMTVAADISALTPGAVIMTLEGEKCALTLKVPAGGEVTALFVSAGAQVTSETPLYAATGLKRQPKYDLIVLGAGPGGYVGALYAAKKGLKTALIEREALGGTCLNAGCIPTKVFFETARTLEAVRTAGVFGVQAQATLDFPAAAERKRAVIATLTGGINGLLAENGVTLYRGTGTLTGAKSVTVEHAGEKTELKARNILIATGSEHVKLPIPGIDLPGVLNSTTLLALETVPPALAIIGGGVIGMEFAFIFNSLGSEVTVLEAEDRVLTGLDPDVSAEITAQARARGIKLYPSARVSAIARNGAGLELTFTQAEATRKLAATHCLVSIGRAPALTGVREFSDLALLPHNRGIAVDRYFATSVPGIYAIGDCIPTMPLAHVASYEAKVAIDNMCGAQKTVNYDYIPYTIFTDPEISCVGIFEAEAQKRKIAYRVVKYYYRDNGKSLIENKTTGFIKLIYDSAGDYLIGAELVGAESDALVNTIVAAIKNKESRASLAEQVFAHPTVGEAVNEAYLALSEMAIHQHG